MMRPVKVASKSLYETSAVSLFAHLPTPTLLAARGFSIRSSYVTHAVTLIFPTDFRAKERLLAVYIKLRKQENQMKRTLRKIARFRKINIIEHYMFSVSLTVDCSQSPIFP